MCGICGVFAYQRPAPVSRALVREMADTLAHRGPDGAGEFYDDPSGLGLGHRRLAIIDLVSGDQPMTGDDGAVCIVFNGEIYNYRKLRAALEAAGHRFRTSSDTEVVLRAYQEYGPQCPARFNGIFAFAIWDARLRRLFLARDHFGVKPLYYSVQQGVFRFASEQKAILLDPSIPREIDLDALHLTLTFRYCPAPHTLFKAIRKLPRPAICWWTSAACAKGGTGTICRTSTGPRRPGRRLRRCATPTTGRCGGRWSATCQSASR